MSNELVSTCNQGTSFFILVGLRSYLRGWPDRRIIYSTLRTISCKPHISLTLSQQRKHIFLARPSDATEFIVPSPTVDVSKFLSGQREELALVALMEVWYTSLLLVKRSRFGQNSLNLT